MTELQIDAPGTCRRGVRVGQFVHYHHPGFRYPIVAICTAVRRRSDCVRLSITLFPPTGEPVFLTQVKHRSRHVPDANDLDDGSWDWAPTARFDGAARVVA